MYAIIETSGKQYKVTPGQVITVDKLGVPLGGTVELDRVLLIADGEKITVGKPIVDGARVRATAQAEGKTKKINVLTFKSKVREHTKQGHRQHYTTLVIDEILPPGAEAAKPAKKRTHRKKEEVEVTENGA